ncbi:MAG: metal ABC transporter permease [Lachnospiraceae bacterium]|nr:metal ABC transporter permease [Lachnospiraceae bacterium]
METIYAIMEKLLPFDYIQYDFMKNALLAVLIITPLFGILGTMIVNNRMAFFSDALGHSALTGMAIGILFGVMDSSGPMLLFAVVFALLLNRIRHSGIVSGDTVISVFSSLSTALGLVILSRGGNFSKYSALLVGDILSIRAEEIGKLLIIFVVTFLFWGFFFNKLHAVSLNSSLAKSKRIPVLLIDNIFVVLIALIVMLSIQWVGILIINALLILPAAAAKNLAANMREYHGFAVMISVFSGVLGLILSYYLDMAAGPMIVVIAALIFFVTLLLRPLVKE